MEIIERLPAGKAVVGAKEVVKSAASGKVKTIIVASNCPEPIMSKLAATGVAVRRFKGDQKALGTALGKPFSVSAAGFEE
jgi:ribosomal protein L30E